MKQKLTLKSLLPAVGWFGLMCILLFMPGGDMPSSGWFERFSLDKLAHFILFFVLIVLFSVPVLKSSLSRKKQSQTILYFAIAAIVWGVITELIQGYFIPNRDMDLKDWLADSAGIIVGFFLIQSIKASFQE